MSDLFLRTLREDPADAEVPSHKLLVRGGYVRRIAPGIYSWLPLGMRVLRNIERIVREEMDAIGGQEVHFPALLPKEPYEATGRWTEYGDALFRLKDRKKADYLLGPTHEELFTLMVKGETSSYRDFPITLYQIQTKYRDEERPRAGILRGREFVMKDSYSFDLSDAAHTSGSSPGSASRSRSSRRCRGRWAGRRPRSSSRPARPGRTPTSAAWSRATPRTSRR
jgi:prolyl-tRNA synthetase